MACRTGRDSGRCLRRFSAVRRTSARRPCVSVNEGRAFALDPIPGCEYWTAVIPVKQGRLHLFKFGLDGDWAPGGDVAGYTSLSYELEGAARGTLSDARSFVSKIYPGAVTTYWVYANHGIDTRRGAPVMVWHEGGDLVSRDPFALRMQVVTDNLVHLGLIPPMVHVLVSPSQPGDDRLPSRFEGEDQENAMRSLQYDTVSAVYAGFLVEEVLPDVERDFKLRSDAYSRASAGASSGGICAFTVAWFRPDRFSRAHAAIGSFTGLQWANETGDGGFMLSNLIRQEKKRNIRVWLSSGSNDLDVPRTGRNDLYVAGSWPLNNLQLANALKHSGYDFHFRFGDGYHSPAQAALDLPDSLAWLWRDYDPDRTDQIFEQDCDERRLPPFRVQVANRPSH